MPSASSCFAAFSTVMEIALVHAPFNVTQERFAPSLGPFANSIRLSSGRDAQRLSTTRAFANEPPTIVVDEPVARSITVRARDDRPAAPTCADQQVAVLVVIHDESPFDRFDRIFRRRGRGWCRTRNRQVGGGTRSASFSSGWRRIQCGRRLLSDSGSTIEMLESSADDEGRRRYAIGG